MTERKCTPFIYMSIAAASQRGGLAVNKEVIHTKAAWLITVVIKQLLNTSF